MDELTRLARAARRGDPAALESFVKASYPQVWRLCAALAGTAMADDLTQETYARCVRNLHQFRGDSSALTWLASIARHVCANELRVIVRNRKHTVAVGEGELDAAALPDATERVAVADLLARLDPDRRAAFVLTQLIGLPYAEAAKACGCPVGTIRSRVARAREDLIAMHGSGEAARWSADQADTS